VQQLVGGLVQLFNGTLATALAPSSAILFDAYPLLRQVEANPGAFGISNITTPACDPQKIAAITNGAVSNGSSLVCSAATLVAPDAARTYLFADGVHPTTVGHAIFAHYVLRALSQHGIDIE
jgi:phospholipase/lecithinase/hemolysin